MRPRALVARLSASGEQLWQRTIGRDLEGTMLAVRGMALRQGKLLLASISFDMNSPPQVQGMVSEVTADGTVSTLDNWDLANYRFEGAQFLPTSTRCWDLQVASDGSVYVAGEFSGPAFSAHVLTRYLLGGP